MGAIKDKGRQLHQIERVPYEDAFLIGDLLTTRTTILSGEPKAGKTLLSAGMGMALLNGEPTFLGQPVLRKLDHIVFGVTDDGAPEELKERLYGAVPDDSVTIFPVEDPGDPHYWAGIGADLADIKPGLFVLDNIIGALAPGEDISSPVTAQRIMHSLRPISEAGIPTLLVTHTPKGTGEGMSVSSSPIGGRAIAAGARGLIALRNSGKHGRRIQTASNRAREDLDLSVTVRRAGESSEVPIWERAEPRLKVVGLPKAKPWDEDLLARIIEEQPEETTYKALALRYAPTVGRKWETVRPKLSEALELVDGRWARKPDATA
ncbi:MULTISPECIES: AAA family ATPase [Streptomyces]|uniref:AAA family ATPase n=1 Tax=Streptomyces sudanensis TaxID=436397 RepID=A0ABY4TEV9_9ACTN|nr:MULTISPECIES: AAA family ATPase [Streptomyces]MCP9959033.1 AAA family ATPase [Streptomyces sudanensis]MCP9988114.1 AAA family ATPase [Streptomyces sudanensis]MCQ0000499.1 AAA family ATPase [Streptomyces sudanensis]URN16066.1 AAA family ATPase [Streptomyces sudanensis]